MFKDDNLQVLQKYIGFYGEKDELRKAKVNSMNENGSYNIQYIDSKENDVIDLDENNNWKYLYTPEEFIKEMLKSIFRFTKDNRINGYSALYEAGHKPLDISYYPVNGEFRVVFSIYDFDKYHQILDGVDNTIEDVFSVDGVLDFENIFTMSHEYCELSFKIPDHYRQWAFVE